MHNNVLSYISRVRESNADFEKASSSERRVMIAHDVIKAIQCGRVVLGTCTYFYHEDIVPDADGDAVFDASCVVCAKGALFVAMLDRFAMPFESLDMIDDPSIHIPDFEQEQLDLIEAVFEGRYMRERMHSYASTSRWAERLMAICRNIINNNGTFIP